MCTLSIIARPGGGFRGVCNRDESRERTASLPPAWRTLDSDIRAIWPTDAAAGGTWIAAAESGILLSLLNYNPAPAVGPTACSPASKGLVSRGLIIPELIRHESVEEIASALQAMELSDFAAFRLVAAELSDGEPQATEFRWDRRLLERFVHEPGPVCFASSGLGDERVLPRLQLFEQMMGSIPTPAAQDRFHAHQWADQPEISVLMSREDARTVSVTRVEVGPGGGRFQVLMRTQPTIDDRARTGIPRAAPYRAPEA